ncbi:Ferric reduction oxidase 7 [Phytophthora citrophthora]|uniref:Ferric reduction oxidase 7 n=1 Tax=Phytophthora citrophthora TaxID=4793 RepID=A0AAD9LHD3_9STRA|nr:Ferric reduction oxidase 7 [Phytophthora citrophthora]
MVDPTYLVLVGVAPTLLCIVIIHSFRPRSRQVSNIAQILRRRPTPTSLSYGELLFLLFLVLGNAVVLWYGFNKRRGRRPRDVPNVPYVRMIGNALGFNCLFNMTLLFLPATRNSSWMEFLGLSYANAIKFHRWIGVAAVLTGIVHCGCYYYGWIQDERWMDMALPCWDCSLRELKGRKVWINVFGELALLCFLLIGLTSIPWVRRKLYNVFYNVHQLLFLSVVFTGLHWTRALWFLLPTFVAYFTSRVLSRYNGSAPAKVVEFSSLSPALCKLVVSIEREQFQVGQFVYVNVPAISRFEWHAFTIASCPGSSSMTLLVKVLGDWTEKLMIYQQLCTSREVEPDVYVDGYYGASLKDTYQSYNTVVLIGGGVGMTPLLSVFEDICMEAETRQAQGRSPLPRRVSAIFVMRELELLREIYPLLTRIRDVDPQGRYVSVHLTITTSPRPEELDYSIYDKRKAYGSSQARTFTPVMKNECPFGGRIDGILHLVAFGSVLGLLTVFQFDNGVLINGLQDAVWAVQSAVKISALFGSGVFVYGVVLVLRWLRDPRTALKESHCDVEWNLKENLLPQTRGTSFIPDMSTYRDLVTDLDVEVGRRPDVERLLRDLHSGHRLRCSGSAIGVLVSGPESLKIATARAVAAIDASAFDVHEEEFEL